MASIRRDRGGKPVGRLHHRGVARASQTAARHRDPEAHSGSLRAGGEAKDGIVGVRLPFISLKQMPDITTFEYRSFLRRLADLDWHVHLHTEGDNLPFFIPKIEASGVKLVIDHLGRPDPKTGIDSEGFKAMLRSIEKGRTWVKMSAGYRLGAQSKDYAQALLRGSGADRLMWASDCPFVGHEKQFSYQSTIDWLTECIPDAATRAKIFGETALRFYFGQTR